MGIGRDLPPRIVVAISATEVRLLGMKAYGYHDDPIAKIDGEKLGVEVHQRMSVPKTPLVGGDAEMVSVRPAIGGRCFLLTGLAIYASLEADRPVAGNPYSHASSAALKSS
jgi:hypothetical protein